MANTIRETVEEIRVKWDHTADPMGHNPGYRRGIDQRGRTVEVNRNLDPNIGHGTVHIDGVLKYDGAPNPVAFLKQYQGLHSFVVLDAE